jgi:subfamily B ATP-binding cassette protein MsbA
MLNSTSNGEVTAKPAAVPKGSAWTVYRRLLAYTWQYKVRLIVSLLFAVFIAASFTTMLIAVREVVNLTYYEPVPVGPGEVAPEDPQEAIVTALHQVRASLNGALARFPGTFLESLVQAPDLEPSFRALVESMRAERFAVMKVTCVLLVIFSLAVGIARFLQEFFAGTISANVSTEMARNMYDNLMAQSVGFFETRTTGDVLARFTNDIFMVNRGLEGVLVKVMREPVKAVCFLGFALYTDPVLTLIGVCGLPPVALILTKIGMKMRKSVRRSLEKISSMASVVHETVNGIAIVKVFTMERYEIDRVRSEIQRLRKFLYQMVRLHATTGPVTEFVLVIGVAFFLLVAGQRMDSGQLDHGEMLTLLLALAMMLDPVRKLSAVNNMIQTSIASAERVFEFIDMRPDIDELKGAAKLPPMRDGIRFDKVTFGYSADTPVLHELDIFVKPGETIALVGHSGSGKSTIVKLIPRFYDVQSGTISIDGTDIRTVSAESLREQISIVTQEPILFAETVRENIAAGRQDYTDEQIRRAAHTANAAEFIEKLPQGYDTRLDESGTTLSGGQRQRLAIARAFIKDPAILILDEATSSLDTESERLIQDALDQFLEDRTAFVIAHRLSTIQRADRILVIQEGRIAEQGNHDALIRHGGVYKRLYDAQFGKGPSDAAGEDDE